MLFAAVLALFFSVVLATPLRQQQLPSQACSPNFEGAAASVTNSVREWKSQRPARLASEVRSPTFPDHDRTVLTTPDFRFEQTGQPGQPPNYIIKPIESNHLAVGVRPDTQSLFLVPYNPQDESQHWNIICDHCPANAANWLGIWSYGCNIKSATTGKCVQANYDNSQPMHLADCNDQDSQNFDFWLGRL